MHIATAITHNKYTAKDNQNIAIVTAQCTIIHKTIKLLKTPKIKSKQ